MDTHLLHWGISPIFTGTHFQRIVSGRQMAVRNTIHPGQSNIPNSAQFFQTIFIMNILRLAKIHRREFKSKCIVFMREPEVFRIHQYPFNHFFPSGKGFRSNRLIT